MANGDPVLTALGNPFLAGGSPVLEGKSIAAITCNLSTVDGGAFVTNPSINLSLLAGRPYKITLNDGAQNLVGWIKDAGTSILNINPALDCAIHDNSDAIRIEDKKLYIGGSQVISTRNTGWTTMAGTAVKNNGGINADTITSSDANMQAMAKALKGVVDALISHGLIGA